MPITPPAPGRPGIRILALLIMVIGWCHAEEQRQFREVPGRRIILQTGRVALPCGAAEIDIPPGTVFLSHGDARHIIEVLWRNPATPSIMGMILPEDADLIRDPAAPRQYSAKDLAADPEALPAMPSAPAPPEPVADPVPAVRNDWALVITWTEGHIHDREMQGLDFDRMLADLRSSIPGSNARRGGGIPQVELVGWAQPPHYDAAGHTLVLSRRLRFYFGGSGQARRLDVGDQINHSAFVIGAKGVVEFNAVADADALPELQRVSKEALARTRMVPGQRYEDFQAGRDPEYRGDLASRLVGLDDPGHILLATKVRYWLWLLVAGVLGGLVLAAIGVVWLQTRAGRRAAASGAAPAGGAAPSSAQRCPRCAQPIHAGAARCPACGASTIRNGAAS